MNTSAILLTTAAAVCLVAALLHFSCIPWGPECYRFMGAGENAVNAAAAGDWCPHFCAVAVGTMLLIWAWYALAGAGLVASPPLKHPVLLIISAVLIVRALAFPFLHPLFPGNSDLFWLVSSGFLGALGLLFFLGVILSGKP